MGQELFSNRRGSDYSNTHINYKVIDNSTTLQEIADRWVSFGFYKSSDRALDALIRGVE